MRRVDITRGAVRGARKKQGAKKWQDFHFRSKKFDVHQARVAVIQRRILWRRLNQGGQVRASRASMRKSVDVLGIAFDETEGAPCLPFLYSTDPACPQYPACAFGVRAREPIGFQSIVNIQHEERFAAHSFIECLLTFRRFYIRLVFHVYSFYDFFFCAGFFLGILQFRGSKSLNAPTVFQIQPLSCNECS
jgi:hypothetical protein